MSSQETNDTSVEEVSLVEGEVLVPCDDAAEPESTLEFRLSGPVEVEKTIPIRKGDLTRVLTDEPGLTEEERVQFVEFGKLLGATLNNEFYGQLHELKELYAPLDPDSEFVDLPGHSLKRDESTDDHFLNRLEQTLTKANYRELTLAAIEEAISTPNEMGLNYVPDFTLFEHLKIFVRGHTRITRDYRSVNTRFRKRRVILDAHRRMVLALKFLPGSKKLGPYVRSDVFYLRMFKDVPHVDMEMHLPEQGTKVRMRLIDKAQIASPLFTGIPTVVAKFLFAATLSPFALAGLLIAPVSAGVNSFFGYQRSKRNHLQSMIHRLYYLTIANNGSVLSRLIDSASDEEYKEALLAYFFLWRAGDDPTRWCVKRTDATIEKYLLEKTGVTVNFEVGDALEKLFRLGLAHAEPDGHISAVPVADALRILDERWDNAFRYQGGLDDG